MENKMKKALAIMALTTALCAGAVKAKANDVDVVKGYNAIEVAADVQTGDSRVRTLNNVDVVIDGTVIGYSGLTEIYNNDATSVFSYNKIKLADKDAENQLVIALKADKDGIFDEKVGVRLKGACKSIGMDYGQLDVLVNKDAAQADLFCGKGIGKGASLELYHSIQNKFGKKASNYSELQLNKDIAKDTALFARMEASNFVKPTYLVGIAKRF